MADDTVSGMDKKFGMGSPTFMLSVLVVYLLLIYKIVPDYMKNRPAYKLKTFIKFYNLAQIAACFYIICEVFNITGVSILHFWKCKIFPSNTPEEERFYSVSYFTFWLKMVELSETIVFVLRKKQNQVSYLHVFHHCSTITLVYMLSKYYNGGATLYPLILNSTVHVIMYSYYLIAAVADPKTVKRLLPVKKSITTIQMIQFVLILMQMLTLSFKCELPKLFLCYYALVICIIFYGFYDFYRKSYTRKSKKSHHN